MKILTFLFIVLLFLYCSKQQNNQTSQIKINSEKELVLSIIEKTNSDSISSYLKEAENICKKKHYLPELAEIQFLQGNLLYEKNNYKDALIKYNEALEIAKTENLTLLTAKCTERLASLNLSMGDDSKALKLYYEALPLFIQTDNKEGIAKVYNIIGLYNHGQKNYDTAEVYYQKAIKLNTEINNITGIVHNKGNLGYLYERTKRYKDAQKLYDELISLLRTEKDSMNLQVIYYNYSSFYQAKNNIDSTIYYLNQAISICEPKQDTSLLTSLYNDLGEIYLNKNNYDIAKKYLEKSILCAIAINDFRNLSQAKKLQIQLDTLMSDYKRAVDNYNQLLVFKDSLYNRRIRNNLKTSELQYENQIKDNLIESEKQKLRAEHKSKTLFIILFFVVFLSSILLIYFIILLKNNKKKQHELLLEKINSKDLQLKLIDEKEKSNQLKIKELEQKITFSMREQITNTLALEQSQKAIEFIKDKINLALNENNTFNSQELNKIISTIKKQITETSVSDTFNRNFNKLHKNFLIKIKQAHPELTQSEIKFCAYLKLHFDGKQIASILNVTPEAIRKTRYRIRKKLRLTKEESLEDYISTFLKKTQKPNP